MNKGVIIYIGKTTDWYARMMYHKTQLMPFDKARLSPCAEDKLDFYEARWIKYFKPEMNKHLKGRRGYMKKKKLPKPFIRMHFRKLTEKSFINFGDRKDWRVEDFFIHNRVLDLISMYYKLSHITFMDNVLDRLNLLSCIYLLKRGQKAILLVLQ